jgi:hypothetical protein
MQRTENAVERKKKVKKRLTAYGIYKKVFPKIGE